MRSSSEAKSTYRTKAHKIAVTPTMEFPQIVVKNKTKTRRAGLLRLMAHILKRTKKGQKKLRILFLAANRNFKKTEAKKIVQSYRHHSIWKKYKEFVFLSRSYHRRK